MAFRDRMRRIFRRPASKDNGKPKIEYYRRGEVPRSKYRGPVDPEHRRRLNSWSFAGATIDRRRSWDLDLSPRTSIPDCSAMVNHHDDIDIDGDPVVIFSPHPLRTEQEGASWTRSWMAMDESVKADQTIESITVVHHEVAPSCSVDNTSQSSTVVGTDRVSSSSPTLRGSCDFPPSRRDAVIQWKEKMRYSFPLVRRLSAPEKRLPMPADDLAFALNTIQIC
ncbi:hypothetical protein V8E54_002951 [Elaphomyces granulatus]